MQIVVRRSVPWFPLVLAAGWLFMLSLALRDLSWFATASFESPPDVRAPSRTAPPAPARTKLTSCPAAALVPVLY